MAEVLRFERFLRQAQQRRTNSSVRRRQVYFDRGELQLLVGLYSENVMAGEWRDYALDHFEGLALFSIFRRSEERPLYVVAKRLATPGTYDYLVFESGQRRTVQSSLAGALNFFRRRLKLVE
ncbi:MAG TPA: DUF2794 domain-containing protein [Kiloniellales bacterium]|nr:DUF2794 domain-containing protein [Kiloniellales bacterium]